MPYDEQTRAVLDKANSNPPVVPGSQSLEEFRGAVEVFRSVGFDREEVAHSADVVIEHEEGRTAARLFVPSTGSPPPVVVWAHGGSWVRVHVDMMDSFYRVVANRSGCAVLAVDYRLSPESRHPAAVHEVYEAARWARANGERFGLDTGRVGVGGESSGANIAAAATLLARARDEFRFAHQTLIVPVLDARFDSPSWDELGQGHMLTTAQMRWAVEQYAPGVDLSDPMLSPLYADDHAGLPPALIVTGEYDPLKDDGTRYAAALERCGVAVDLHQYEGLIHHALMMPKTIGLGDRMIKETALLMGKALGASGASAR